MTRLNLMLTLAVVLSALYLVHTQYESRRLFVELDRATALAHRLDVDHDRLVVEGRAQSTPLRVEKLAKEQLHMRTATPAITKYMNLTTGAPVPMPVASAPAKAPAAKGATR